MSRTPEERQEIRQALGEMCEACGVFVGQFTFTGYARALMPFDTRVVVQALQLVHLVVHGRTPTVSDAVRIAEQIRRRGFAACRQAAWDWPHYKPKGDHSALTLRGWIEAVDAAAKMLGNPDAPPPVALLAEEATPSQETLERNRRQQELMDRGMGPLAAACLVGGIDLDVPSMPTKRRARQPA